MGKSFRTKQSDTPRKLKIKLAAKIRANPDNPGL